MANTILVSRISLIKLMRKFKKDDMKNKLSFYQILILVWTIIIPTTMSTLIVIVYLEEIGKITFIDNTLMKIAFVVSVLHLIIMLVIAIISTINDIKEMKKNC